MFGGLPSILFGPPFFPLDGGLAMALRKLHRSVTRGSSGRRVEGLERREMMAFEAFSAPIAPLEGLPSEGPAEIQPVAVQLDAELEINPGIFDDIGPLLPVSDPFVGTWVNVDSGTGGITKIQITEDASGHHIEAWGACLPTDCEWGKVNLDLLGTSVSDPTPDYAIGQWDPGFKDATMTLELVEDGLIVDLYNVFKDDSGREGFHQRYRLTDSGDLIQHYVVFDDDFDGALIGGWVSEDPHSRGITKLVISPNGEGLDAEAWGACTPADCEWGTVPMHTIGTTISDTEPEQSVAHWDHGFSTVFMTTHLSDSELILQRYTVFHDGSDRSNYYSEESMWKLGDANHDGVFNSSDLVKVFQAGEYEDGIAGNSDWEEGDWNRDGDFDSADILLAMQTGGYEASPLTELASIHLPQLFPRPDFDLPGDPRFQRTQLIDEVFQRTDIGDLLPALPGAGWMR
jgi:hypothetical protein